MRISILVPLYRSENFVGRCCESLFTQSIEELEYIFISDCSPDKSIEIVENYLNKYPKRKQQTHIIALEENHGVAYVRNLLLSKAQGEYLLFVDSDDWIEQDTIGVLYEKVKECKADVVSFGFFCENKNRTTPRLFHYSSITQCLYDIIGNKWGVVWRFLFRRDIIEKNAIRFPTGLQGGEDYVFCAKFISCAESIISIKRPLYHYVTYNSNSLITTQNLNSIIHQYLATNIIEDFLKKRSMLPQYKRALNKRKYYVKKNILAFLRRQWGSLVFTGIRCECNFYLQKAQNLYHRIIIKKSR